MLENDSTNFVLHAKSDQIYYEGNEVLRVLDNFLRGNSTYIGIEVEVGFLPMQAPGESSIRVMKGNGTLVEGTDYIVKRVQTSTGWIEL